MTYTTEQIREFCDAFDRGELEYCGMNDIWRNVSSNPYSLSYCINNYDLRVAPKPTPPVYEQWTDIKEVPLEHWYRNKLEIKTGGIYHVTGVTKDGLIIGGHLRAFGELFTTYIHSPDPFAPESEWMVCGRVKG